MLFPTCQGSKLVESVINSDDLHGLNASTFVLLEVRVRPRFATFANCCVLITSGNMGDALDVLVDSAFPKMPMKEFVKLVPPKYKKHPHAELLYKCINEERKCKILEFKSYVWNEIERIKRNTEPTTINEVLCLLKSLEERLVGAVEYLAEDFDQSDSSC